MAIKWIRCVLFTAWALSGCAGPQSEPLLVADGEAPDSSTLADDDYAAMQSALTAGEAREVLVVLADGGVAREDTAEAKRQVRSVVAGDDQLFEGQALPLVALRLRSRAELDAIEQTPGVMRVEPNRIHLANATPNLELIGQPIALGRGADGAGYSVAVLDTGVDYTRSEMGPCTAPGVPSTCAVPVAMDFATDDGTLDQSIRHGSNVAAIIRSVAPASKIIALDVFDGGGASSLTISRAIDWVIANKDTHKIVAANLSLGYGGFSAPCGTDVLAIALQRLRDAGIIPVVATGNSGYLNAISSPACGPAAVSVGAVDSTGVVTSFSNSATFVSLLAPGVGIAGGGVTMSGTSQATPHVAGALVALRSAYPTETISQLITRLTSTGVATRDSRNGITLPRLDLGASTARAESAAPTGTLTLTSAFVRVASVGFTLNASDASGVQSMCVSTSTACTTYVAFATSGTATLPAGNGVKTVRVWLKDTLGNTTTTPLSATVTLDAAPPTGGVVGATAGIGASSLVWQGFADALSGVEKYRVVFATGATAPATCSAGTLATETTGSSFVHTSLTNGTVYRYRVCAIDRAGNVSTGVVASATPVGEQTPPTGSIVIANGAQWTNTTRVQLTLGATDTSGVTSMCLSATTSCAAWQAYATSAVFTLSSTAGDKTVYVRFADRWGNISAPVFDTIRLDATPPPDPTVSAAPGSRALTLTWADVADSAGGSGLAKYLVTYSQTAATAVRCAGGTEVAISGAATRTFSASALTAGRTTYWRVCAVDALGNVSNGRTGALVPTP